jgi:NitT/TauT family transport system ATP-binding protein
VDLMLTAEFMQLNRQVFDLIREETMKSMALGASQLGAEYKCL